MDFFWRAKQDKIVDDDLAAPTSGNVQDYAEHIRAEQVRFLYAQNMTVLTSAFVGGGALMIILVQMVPSPLLYSWFAFHVGVLALRGALARRYRRAPSRVEQTARWRLRFLMGAGLSGLSWGLIPILFFPLLPPFSQVFVSLILVGVGVSSVSTLAVDLSSYY